MSWLRKFEILALCLVLAGCGDRPHAKDQEMLDNFARHEKGFEELVAMLRQDRKLVRMDSDWTDPADPSAAAVSTERIAEYRRRFKELGIPRGLRASHDPESFTFIASAVGLGISGSGKGYAYLASPPDLIVKDLDACKSADGRSFFAYRSIKGNWYLFLDSED
jgi:hypothetical protein